MKITIRKALPEDACDYTACLISCWQSAYKGIVPDEYLMNMWTEKEQRVERYKKNLSDPGECIYYCVMCSEKMIGFLIINKSLNEDTPFIGGIWAIYLMEEFRGKGYGTEMLHFAINELKRMGHTEIGLWVFEENNRARRFYEKHGFRFEGIKREVKYGKLLIELRYVLNFDDKQHTKE